MDSSPIEPPVQCQPVVVQCTCCQSVRQNEELDPIGGVFLVLFIQRAVKPLPSGGGCQSVCRFSGRMVT